VQERLNKFAMLSFGIFAMDMPDKTTIPEKGKVK
jgi:hypothetical protein